jgi:hypothetical protein
LPKQFHAGHVKKTLTMITINANIMKDLEPTAQCTIQKAVAKFYLPPEGLCGGV